MSKRGLRPTTILSHEPHSEPLYFNSFFVETSSELISTSSELIPTIGELRKIAFDLKHFKKLRSAIQNHINNFEHLLIDMEDRRQLCNQFLEAFPLSKLKDLTLDAYTNLNKDNSFCYWLESRTTGLGSFRGGYSIKFSIYAYRNKPASDGSVKSDDKYACYLQRTDSTQGKTLL